MTNFNETIETDGTVESFENLIAKHDAQEAKILEACRVLSETLDEIDELDFRPVESIELVKTAVKILNGVCQPHNDYHEFTEALEELSAAAVGQVVLKTLPSIDGRWPAEQKAFWISVGEELGPDWIETFRSVGAFLKRVEGF